MDIDPVEIILRVLGHCQAKVEDACSAGLDDTPSRLRLVEAAVDLGFSEFLTANALIAQRLSISAIPGIAAGEVAW